MNNFFVKQVRSGNPCATAAFAALLLALFLPSSLCRGEISEPDTIFYGKVINRTSGQEYLLTQGSLVWVVSRPDGRQITLTASLQPLNDGLYSYRLAVPHEALAYGLTASLASVPLTTQTATCSHAQIAVNGSPATIIAPGGSAFAVSQALRAATYRLDLELSNPLPVTGGDGIPDWWKARYGLTDPNGDPDGDGWSNLQEFRYRGSPTNDNRLPTLETRELYAYADGLTGIRLDAVDSDSGPTNLFYTLTTLPQRGVLFFRNRTDNSDVALATGAAFTQDEVNQGRLFFRHAGTNVFAASDTFGVSLRDENANHPAANAVVQLNVYRPAYDDLTLQAARAAAASPAGAPRISGISASEQQMLVNYFQSRDQGYMIWDGSRGAAAQEFTVPSSGLSSAQYSQYLLTSGHDHRHVLLAGAGDDHLVGGMENDILVSGSGNARLRGNGGGDLFVILGPASGLVVEDFSVPENDVLDISRVLTGTSSALSNYVQVTSSGANSYLRINYSGAGADFTDMVLTLLNTHLAQTDLRSLVDNGNLVTGEKALPPQISIAASTASASQNGPVPGQFTLSRSGAIASALTVKLQLSGSALNGSDYQSIPPQATFAAGQRTLTLSVNPYPTLAAFTQYVQVTIVGSTDYELGALTTAVVSIEPLASQVSIQALEPIASKVDQTSGYFLVSRGGVINNSLLVRLTIGGSAPVSHYNSVATFLNFGPQQTTALIAITPKATAVLSNGLEFVQVSIKPDTAYRVMSPASDRVLLVEQIMTFALWQQKYFPGSAQGPASFAMEDPGQTGIRNLFRYAYGLNPISPQNSIGIPSARVLDDHLSLSFIRPPAISDLDYIVEVSEDLLTWNSAGDLARQFFPSASSNDVQTVFFRANNLVSATPKLFMRVRVEQR